jgi:hypothetical protein
MSLLMTESPKYAAPIEMPRVAATTRMVDTATRLHAWSIPLPCCVHEVPFEQHCEHCSVVAPVTR